MNDDEPTNITVLELVELVGGPLCGNSVQWDSPCNVMRIEYYGGFAFYSRESAEKAIYLKG